MVVRVNERRTGSLLYLGRRCLSRFERRAAEDHLGAVTFDGGSLHGRCGFRHYNERRHASHFRGQGEGLRVVSRTVRHDAARRVFITELADRVAGSAEFERADFLKVLALEEQSPTGQFVERRARHDGSSMGDAGNPPGRGFNISGSNGSVHWVPF